MTETVTRGRPRDPAVEKRALRAALEVFGEVGWGGFRLDVVARRARIGKASLYRRRSSREDLLSDAIQRGAQSSAAASCRPERRSLW